jgi:hypothetical protein
MLEKGTSGKQEDWRDVTPQPFLQLFKYSPTTFSLGLISSFMAARKVPHDKQKDMGKGQERRRSKV